MFLYRVRKLLIVLGLCFALVQKSDIRVRKSLKTLVRKMYGVLHIVAKRWRRRVSALVLMRVTLLLRPMLRLGQLLP
jgi:hypothetical protein